MKKYGKITKNIQRKNLMTVCQFRTIIFLYYLLVRYENTFFIMNRLQYPKYKIPNAVPIFCGSYWKTVLLLCDLKVNPFRILNIE